MCWLRMAPYWPSETCKALSPLTINVVLIGRKWLCSRAGLVLEAGWGARGERDVRVQVGSSGGSWFCVFSAKGPFGFRWWHSTSLTRPCLGAGMQGCRGDLLSMIHPKPPQIKGMALSWKQITAALQKNAGWESVKSDLRHALSIFMRILFMWY